MTRDADVLGTGKGAKEGVPTTLVGRTTTMSYGAEVWDWGTGLVNG